MNMQTRKIRSIVTLSLAVVVGLALGLVFVLSALPAQASPIAQPYPGDTATPTVTFTATTTFTPTVTLTGTLGAPARTGTPTSLLPVTGVDLTQQDGGGSVGLWIAVWLLGLLLIWFGLRARSSKQE